MSGRGRHPARGGFARLGATLLLLVGVAIAAVTASAWRASVEQRAERGMEVTAGAASAVVTSRIARNVDLLEQLRALVVATPDITNAEFARYWEAAAVEERFPGVLGMVRVDRVPASELDGFLDAAAADPVTGLEVVDELTVFPEGEREEYCLQHVGLFGIRQVEGFVIPAGLDFCADDLDLGLPISLPDAFRAATDSAGLVTLRYDPLDGLLVVVLPIYGGEGMPATLEQRRAQSSGWVVSTFDPASLTVDAGGGSALAIEVRHVDLLGEEVIAPFPDDLPANDEAVRVADTEDSWSIEVVGDISTEASSADRQGLVVLTVGLLLTLGGAAYIWLLSGARDRALELVAERTDELAYQALHDELTGLPNRALIRERAHGLLERSRRDGTPVAALFLDLDDFKSVNDTLGHGAGDELLVATAQRFENALRGSDTVGRLGGDEFVILLDGDSLAAGPEVVAQRLLDALLEPFAIAGETLHVSVSIGIASGPRADVDEWLRDADIALYAAKGEGKDRYAVFRPSMFTG